MLSEGSARKYAMDWAGVRRLAESTFATIGCHALTHVNLRSLSETELRRQLSDSKARIERETGRLVRHVAFPFGGRQEAGDREYRIAAETGFLTASTSIPGSLGKDARKLLHRLPRIFVREGRGVPQLIAENRARVWLNGVRSLIRS